MHPCETAHGLRPLNFEVGLTFDETPAGVTPNTLGSHLIVPPDKLLQCSRRRLILTPRRPTCLCGPLCSLLGADSAFPGDIRQND